jgi:hypothetical protein
MGLRDQQFAANNVTFWKQTCILTFSNTDEHDFKSHTAKPWPWNLQRSDKLRRFVAFIQDIEEKGYFDAYVAPQTSLLLHSEAYRENEKQAVFRVDNRNDSAIDEHHTSEGCIADISQLSIGINHGCKSPFSPEACEPKKCKDLLRRYYAEWEAMGKGVIGDNYCAQGNKCSENDVYHFCYHNGARQPTDPWLITMDDLLQRDDSTAQRGVAHLLQRLCLLYTADYQCLPLKPPPDYFTGARNCELKPKFR